MWEPYDVFIHCWSKFDLNSWFSVQSQHNIRLQLARFVLTLLFVRRKICHCDCPYCYSVTVCDNSCERAQSASVHGSWKLQLWGSAWQLGNVAGLIPTQEPESIVVLDHLSDCNKLTDYLIGYLCRVWRWLGGSEDEEGMERQMRELMFYITG